MNDNLINPFPSGGLSWTYKISGKDIEILGLPKCDKHSQTIKHEDSTYFCPDKTCNFNKTESEYQEILQKAKDDIKNHIKLQNKSKENWHNTSWGKIFIGVTVVVIGFIVTQKFISPLIFPKDKETTKQNLLQQKQESNPKESSLLKADTTQKKSLSKYSPKTVSELFEVDFKHLLKYSRAYSITIIENTTQNKVAVNIVAQMYNDFDAQSNFLGFYIPDTPYTYLVCEFIAKNYKKQLSELMLNRIEQNSPGDIPTELKDLKFSGRVFIYHDTPLFNSDRENLIKIYKENGLSPQFRGVDFLIAQKRN